MGVGKPCNAKWAVMPACGFVSVVDWCAGARTHVGVLVHNGRVSIFVNGKLEADEAAQVALNDSPKYVHIGEKRGNIKRFNGDIALFRVFDNLPRPFDVSPLVKRSTAAVKQATSLAPLVAIEFRRGMPEVVRGAKAFIPCWPSASPQPKPQPLDSIITNSVQRHLSTRYTAQCVASTTDDVNALQAASFILANLVRLLDEQQVVRDAYPASKVREVVCLCLVRRVFCSSVGGGWFRQVTVGLW